MLLSGASPGNSADACSMKNVSPSFGRITSGADVFIVAIRIQRSSQFFHQERVREGGKEEGGMDDGGISMPLATRSQFTGRKEERSE